MRILFGLMAVAHLGLLIAAMVAAASSYRPPPTVYLVMAALFLNTLVFGLGWWHWPDTEKKAKQGRVARLFGLWLDVKETELKKRAGAEAPTES